MKKSGWLSRLGLLAAIAAFVLPGPANTKAQSPGQAGLRDPEFSKLPFDRWLTEGERTGLKWTAEILPAEISTHQRLMLRVVIRVDGSTLEKRRGSGNFLTLVQYKDKHGGVWQNHTSLDLARLPPGAGTRQIAIAQYAFVLPGDYSLAIAVYDTATLEYNLIFREVHAEPLKTDPLPRAWAGLPWVEFIPAITEPPDVWYLPGIEGRLNLSLTTRRPVHIQLLVNTTPSAAGSLAAMRADMSAVIPALKVLSQIEVRNGFMDAAFLDLTRRRVSLEQRNIRSLAWDRIRDVFTDAKPGMIDVRDLAAQSSALRFFRDEVVRRLGTGAPDTGEAVSQIVIVLSGPAFLGNQQPLSPLEPPENPEAQLFYIRFVTRPELRDRPRGLRGAFPTALPATPVDDFEHTLVPLNARLYDATSVEQFREILANMLDRISRI